MNYFNSDTFWPALVFCALVSAPSTASAACDLENFPVSLETVNKPVKDILSEIEKQTEFTIQAQNQEVLTTTRTIHLNKTPLDLALNRLLKDLSYSLICDNDQKLIRLVFLDKGSPTQSTGNPNVPTNNMDDLDKAMSDFQKNIQHQPEQPMQEAEQMQGASAALEDFRNKKKNNPNDTPNLNTPAAQKTTMDAASDALVQYEEKKKSTPSTSASLPNEEIDAGPMGELDRAMSEFQQAARPQTTSATAETTSMTGASSALEELNQKAHNQ